MDKKNLLEFLKILVDLTQRNIDFIERKEIQNQFVSLEYREELTKIQDVINDFDFVKFKFIRKEK